MPVNSQPMWNPFAAKPACPVEPDQQQWINARFAWLQEQFGYDAPAKARVVLPTLEFFPDRYDGREEDVAAMFARIASYMNIDPERFGLFFYAAGGVLPTGIGLHQGRSSVGLYIREAVDGSGAPPRPVIGIETSHLNDPVSVAATIAHELAHDLLLGAGRLD